MRIACIELTVGNRMATGERSDAIVTFLKNRGHAVDVIAPSPARVQEFARFRFSAWSRFKRRALGHRFLPHFWDYVADEIEPMLHERHYDVVIGRSHPTAYVLTRLNANTLKIFDMANVGFLEAYHGWNADLNEVESEYGKEMEIYEAVDHLITHHPILANFVRRHVFDSAKVMAIRMGCYPASSAARFSDSPRLVYAGSYHYIQDPYLLSLLTRRSPYPIDCYGQKNPNYSFLPASLAYRGFREDTEFLADYQAGVITISTDRLRRHSPSTKFAYYFVHGLPVLFPEWLEEGHTYAAAVPYSEETFADQARRICSDRSRWEELSRSAIEIAADLSWERVLEPLAVLIANWRGGDGADRTSCHVERDGRTR